MVAQTQTRTIIIKSDVGGAKGLRQVAKDLAQINKSTLDTSKSLKSAASTFEFFRNALGGILAGIGVRQIIGIADEFQLLRDRIKAFTGSAEEADVAFNKIAQAAKFARTSVASLATIYNRVALATSDLGLSSEAVIALTLSLQQTFRIAGSTIAETTGAVVQLAQGLASGQLRGQELRSVLEQNVIFGALLAKQLGVTRGQLIKFAETGQITSQVVLKALAENFEDLNKTASEFQTTVGQALTVAIDQVGVKIDSLNKSINGTGSIVSGIEFLVNNMEILVGVMAGLALLFIPKLIKGFKLLRAAIVANPIGLIATVITAVLIPAFIEWEKTVLRLKLLFFNAMKFIAETTLSAITIFRSFLTLIGFNLPDNTETIRAYQEDIKKFGMEADGASKALDAMNTSIDKTVLDGYSKALKEAAAKVGNLSKVGLKELNAQVDSGTISVSEYTRALNNIEIEKINEDFKNGKIDLDRYNQSLLKVSENFNPESALFVGTRNYINQAGTFANNVANVITQTFSRLEDTMVEFTKTGRFEFAKFAQAVIEDINRIIIRATIIKPLANAITSAFAGAATPSAPQEGGSFSFGSPNTGSGAVAARGQAFQSGIQMFANGGVVDKPTLFSFSGGKRGLMGEAGPEAILPLRKNSKGELGVSAKSESKNSVTVNVINNTNAQITTRETETDGKRLMEVLIDNRIQENINTGRLDRTLSTNFGINRKGR